MADECVIQLTVEEVKQLAVSRLCSTTGNSPAKWPFTTKTPLQLLAMPITMGLAQNGMLRIIFRDPEPEPVPVPTPEFAVRPKPKAKKKGQWRGGSSKKKK